jgi:hypothetical protein
MGWPFPAPRPVGFPILATILLPALLAPAAHITGPGD